MNLLTGEYNNTIDDKGRVSFPVKLRTAVNQNVLMVTKGLDTCLWLFTMEEFESFKNKLTGNASMMKKKNLQVVRHFVASAQPVEFDKNGLITKGYVEIDSHYYQLYSGTWTAVEAAKKDTYPTT